MSIISEMLKKLKAHKSVDLSDEDLKKIALEELEKIKSELSKSKKT